MISVSQLAADGEPIRACLVHVSESYGATRTRLLDQELLTIGRGATCDIEVRSSHVSRLHARVMREEGEWILEDGGSANGFLLNGKRIQRAPLRFGDRIDLGRGELLLFRSYDATYQSALENQKLEALGRLAGGVAHDFNNVLAAIVGASLCLQGELMEQSGEAGDEILDDSIRDIISACEYGAGLAKQLLGFARRSKQSETQVAMAELLDEVLNLAERTFDQAIEIEARIASDAYVVADRAQLSQVFMNLCINARDAMPEGGQLRVELGLVDCREDGGRRVCVKVSDTGAGMPPEVKAHIFEPFYSTKDEGRGTGLGLSTVYGIVRGCGGEIEVESSPGEGTTMVVYLPSVSVRPKPISNNPPVTRTKFLGLYGEGRAILLVEDQELLRRHTRRLLTKLGFQVIEAANGDEAIEWVQKSDTTLALAMIDLQMPRKSGDKACRLIRQLDPELPIVMVSGNINDPRIAALQADEEGVGVLSKPYGVDELNEVLQAAR